MTSLNWTRSLAPGIMAEKDYPYTAKDGTCAFDASKTVVDVIQRFVTNSKSILTNKIKQCQFDGAWRGWNGDCFGRLPAHFNRLRSGRRLRPLQRWRLHLDHMQKRPVRCVSLSARNCQVHSYKMFELCATLSYAFNYAFYFWRRSTKTNFLFRCKPRCARCWIWARAQGQTAQVLGREKLVGWFVGTQGWFCLVQLKNQLEGNF